MRETTSNSDEHSIPVMLASKATENLSAKTFSQLYRNDGGIVWFHLLLGKSLRQCITYNQMSNRLHEG